MPATTITRCADPPVPSAAGASLQSAVTVSREASTDGDDVERELPGGRARQRAGGDRGERPHRGDRRVDRRRAGPSSASDARSVVASRKPMPASTASPAWSPSQAPTSHTASTASPMSGRSVSHDVGVGVRRSSPPAGVGSRSDDCSSRRSRAGDHGVSCGLVGRDEAHELGEVVGPEELHRVDVAVPDPQPEVEDGPVVVAVVPVRHRWCRRRRRARPTARARTDDAREERVRGAQPAGVGDGDVQRAGDAAREADHAVVGGAHRRARRGGEVGAAVPGAVDRRRLLERVRPARRRPGAASPRRRRCRRRRGRAAR